jgi:hypothetical protein
MSAAEADSLVFFMFVGDSRVRLAARENRSVRGQAQKADMRESYIVQEVNRVG